MRHYQPVRVDADAPSCPTTGVMRPVIRDERHAILLSMHSTNGMNIWTLALAACLSGCVASSGAVTTPERSRIPYMQNAPPQATLDSRPTPIQDAALALAIPFLYRVTLPEGARELRASNGYSMILGAPQGVVRLIEQRGRQPIGQVLFVWAERREWPRRYRATRCTPWVNNARSCVFVAPTRMNWRAVAARFEELGGWTLNSPCEADGANWMDAGELEIRRLQAARFEAYNCNAPEHRVTDSAGRAARSLYNYVLSLLQQAPSPPPA